MTRALEHLVELADLAPAETQRLERVHALLLAAGPGAELPPALAQLPGTLSGHSHRALLRAPRRRPTLIVLIAALVAAASFGGGDLLAARTHGDGSRTVRVVSLQGTGARDSLAALRVGAADANGNWPVELTVTGLPRLASASARYMLVLWVRGKPSWLCGAFRAGGARSTTVAFSVPYTITKQTRWVVTEIDRGGHFPGRIVMTTT